MRAALDEDAQVFDDLLLSGEILQLLRADFIFEFEIALYVSDRRHGYKG